MLAIVGIVGTSLLGSMNAFTGTKNVEAAATPTKVDQNSTIMNSKQSLIISKSAPEKKVVITSTGLPTGYTAKYEAKGTDVYSAFQSTYGATSVALPAGKDFNGSTISMQYGQVGSYNGDPISAKVTFSDIKSNPKFAGKTQYIRISDSLYSGYDWYGIENVKAKFDFTDTKTGSPVTFNKDSFLTFASLNGIAYQSVASGVVAPKLADRREFVANTGLNSYITKDSILGTFSGPNSVGTVIGGPNKLNSDWLKNKVTSGFEDVLGSPTFKNSAVSFQLDGAAPTFTLGSTATQATFWWSPSSAMLFTVVPSKPTKTVTDDADKNINKQTVYPNDTLNYNVSQKVGVLGVDTLSRYTTFSYQDPLPQGVTYQSASLVDKDGKAVDPTGTYNYDASTRTVKYTASKTFLNSMALNGETYTLKTKVKVNDLKTPTVLNNTATTTIDGNKGTTNMVTNTTVVPKTSTNSKSIVVDGKDTTATQAVALGSDVKYDLNAYISDAHVTHKSLSISDPLVSVLSYKSATITDTDDSNKDVTNQFTLDTSNGIKWTAKDANAFNGHHLKVALTVTLNKDSSKLNSLVADGTLKIVDGKIEIPNKSNLNIDSDTIPSDTVTVTPPTVSQWNDKFVEQTSANN